MNVSPLPEGTTQAVIPYLIVNDAHKAIDFYKKVFAAQEIMRMPSEDKKKILHAELQVAGCLIWLADDCSDMKHMRSPKSVGATTVSMNMYCLDADKVFNRAVKAGCSVAKPLENQFWGDRMGTVIDPFGHMWTLLQRVEEVTPAEMTKRYKAMAGKS